MDREKLAEAVLGPLGLPTEPLGSHLALAGQPVYADGSGALGEPDVKEDRALLADAGWVPGGPVRESKRTEKAAGAERADEDSPGGDDGTYIVGEEDDDKNDSGDSGKGDGGADPHDRKSAEKREGERQSGERAGAQGGGAPGAYAPQGTAAPGGPAAAPLAKDGKPLTLRFVLPRPRLRHAAHGRRADRRHAGPHRHPYRDQQGVRRELLQGPHRLRRLRPRPVLLARLAVPRHRRPAHLRQARPGRRRLAQRRNNGTRVGPTGPQLFEQAAGTLDEEPAPAAQAVPRPRRHRVRDDDLQERGVLFVEPGTGCTRA
ncbi:Lipoprotein OS=Streptomyces fumanus OX=67302 GN=GCM10018772_48990 PE=4 SV=1 [Streptomyces fumanus]